MGGHAWGPRYLLFRVPLQSLILAWVYWFTIRSPVPAGRGGRQEVTGHHAVAGK